jgi:putative tryptophan/tyrosine transport system substrate-binding protein
MFQIRRQEFVRSLGALIGAAAVCPLAVRAQEPGRIYRLGELHLSPRHTPWNDALFEALKADGFIEGQNLLLDQEGFGLRVDEVAAHAAAIAKAQVDVIVATGDPPVRSAQQATKSIPILAIAEDMVGSGFVASLAEPKGNTTGVSLLSTELNGKRQEILIEALPAIKRMAILADTASVSRRQLQILQDAGRARGVEFSIHGVTKREEIEGAVNAAKDAGAGAVNVLASTTLFNNREIILSRTAALRLPAIYQWPDLAEEGGLIGYGPRLPQIYQDIMAHQFVKLLRGVKPAEIPVEQPTKFQMWINLKIAKADGLTIPDSLLLRADKVIE